MSLWIKRDVLLPRNRKTYRLAELLAQGGGRLFAERDEVAWRAIAIVLLEQFWAHVTEHYPAGDVTDAPKAELSDALMPWLSGTEWAVQDVRILLQKSGHIVVTRRGRQLVRDWLEWTGSDAMRLAKDRKRKRMARAKRPRTRPPIKEGRGAGQTALAEKSRAELSREEKLQEQKGGAAVVMDELRGLLPEPYRPSLEGLLRSARNPEAAAYSIRALGPGGIHERYSWEIVGRGLFELAAAGALFSPKTLDAFCRRVGEVPATGPGALTDAQRMARALEEQQRQGATP